MFITIRYVMIDKTKQNAVSILIVPPPEYFKVKKIKDLALSNESIKMMSDIKNTKYLLGLNLIQYDILYPFYDDITDEEYWASYTTKQLYDHNNIKLSDGKLTRFELICALRSLSFL